MKALDAAAAAVVLTVAVQAPASYQALTSAVVNIRSHSQAGGDLRDIRDAEVISAVVVGLVGAAGAAALKSPVPLIVAFAADVVMVAIYEYALRTRHDPIMGRESSNVAVTGTPDAY